MKIMKKLMAAAIFVCSLAVLTGGPAKAMAAFTSADTAKVTGELNLRDGKSTSNTKVLLVIPKNKIVDILSGEDNGWYKVDYKGKVGYVSGKYLAKNTDLVTTTARLNLRSSINTTNSTNVILVIPKGASAAVISRYTNGWYKIKYNKKTGYVDGDYLNDPRLQASKTTKRVAAVNVNMRKTRDTSDRTNIILTIPKGAEVTVSGQVQGGWIKVTYKKKTGYVKEQYLKTASTKKTTTVTRVTKYRVNLRSSMKTSIASNIILTLPKGAKVTILSTEEDNWYRVSYGGEIGYVRGGYFE